MEPKDFFRVLVRRKKTVITAIVIVLVTAMYGSMRKAPSYGTSCSILIQAVGEDLTNDKGSNSVETLSSFQTLKAVIESPLMAKRAASVLKVSEGRVTGRVNATLLPNTAIYELKTVDGDAKFVSALCNGYAIAVIQYRQEQAKAYLTQAAKTLLSDYEELQAKADELQKKIDIEKRNGNNNPIGDLVNLNTYLFQASDRLQRYSKVQTQLSIVDQGGGQVIKPAPPAGGKLGPNHKRDGMLGLMVGLIFGAALAFVREYMDDTLRDKESAQKELGIPVLGSMPAEAGIAGYVDPASKSLEAARTLRTNLSTLGFPHDVRALVVTSTLSKRRANAVVNLAAAVAEAGRTVLVVGADFRNARLHEQFGVGNAIGLTSVIRGQMSLDQAVRPVPGLDGVYLLPSGPQVANPGELLSSDAMEDLLHEARAWADAVIVDAPPVLTAADASVLGTLADGVILVMSAGQTQRIQAIEAKDQLVAAGAKVLGAVLAGVSEQPGRVLSLGQFRKDDDDDELPPLMPYGAWAGAGGMEWGGPMLFDPPADYARTRPSRRTSGGGRNGGGVKRNGNGYAKRTGNSHAKRTGSGGARRTGNGHARTGNGHGTQQPRHRSSGASSAKTGARNGGTVARNGGGTTRGRNGKDAPARKVLAAKRSRRTGR